MQSIKSKGERAAWGIVVVVPLVLLVLGALGVYVTVRWEDAVRRERARIEAALTPERRQARDLQQQQQRQAEERRLQANEQAYARSVEEQKRAHAVEVELCALRSACSKYPAARQDCATAANFSRCIEIKTGRAVDEGTCTLKGEVSNPPDNMPGWFACLGD